MTFEMEVTYVDFDKAPIVARYERFLTFHDILTRLFSIPEYKKGTFQRISETEIQNVVVEFKEDTCSFHRIILRRVGG